MRTIDLLGILVSALGLEATVAEMTASIDQGLRSFACTCPVYTLMRGVECGQVRSALNSATWVAADGMPVVWALRALGATRAGRVYGPDLMLALSEVSGRMGFRQFYLGGAEGVAEEVAKRLVLRYPGLRVAGAYSPPFRDMSESEEQGMIARINDSGADIVWVGLGSPKQDLWMAKMRPRLRASLLVGVGAAFDFLAGRIPQAPTWMQRSGLEWIYRFAHEPRRLWRRYLVYNPKFIWHFGKQLVRPSRRRSQPESPTSTRSPRG